MTGKFQLISSISLRDGLDQNQKILFTALMLTALLVFLAENLLLWDQHVLYDSAKVFIPCAAILLVFYSVSSICSSIIIGLISIYLLLWLVPNLQSNYFDCTILIIFMAAFFYALINLRLSKVGLKNSAVMSLFSTMTIVGVAHPATSFDMFDRVVYGFIYKDTLFHASLAAMIKNYNSASSGLNGLIEVPYHNFSHHLYAALATFGNQAVIEVYGVATHVLFAPILIFSLASAAYTLSPKTNSIKISWCLFSFFLAIVPAVLYKWGAIWEQYFTSESYLVSLSLFVLTIALINKQKLKNSDILVLLISTAMITSAKATVGIVLVTLYLGRFIFKNRNWKEFGIALILMCTVASLLYPVASSPGYGTETKISLLHFIQSESPWGRYLTDFYDYYVTNNVFSKKLFFLSLIYSVIFLILHFIFSWIDLILIIRQGKSFLFYREYEFIYVSISLLFGLGIILLFYIGGGSAFYFTNVAFFIAILYFVPRFSNVFSEGFSQERKLLVFLMILMVLISYPGVLFQSKWSDIRRGNVRRDESAIDNGKEFVAQMQQMRNSVPKNVILEPDLDLMLKNPQKQFNAQPFMLPAISEHAWVGVIRAPEPFEVKVAQHLNYWSYGYEMYGITPTQQRVNVPARIPKGMKVESYRDYQYK